MYILRSPPLWFFGSSMLSGLISFTPRGDAMHSLGALSLMFTQFLPGFCALRISGFGVVSGTWGVLAFGCLGCWALGLLSVETRDEVCVSGLLG